MNRNAGKLLAASVLVAGAVTAILMLAYGSSMAARWWFTPGFVGAQLLADVFPPETERQVELWATAGVVVAWLFWTAVLAAIGAACRSVAGMRRAAR